MELIPDLGLGINYTWVLSAGYYILSIALLLLFPRHIVGKFANTVKVKGLNTINFVLYYGFLIFTIFIPLKINTPIFYSGLGIFIIGMILYAVSLFSFAATDLDKPAVSRIYKYSRHPVYVSFFVLSIGIALAAASWILSAVAVFHFICSYFIMKKEEETCVKKYGDEYKEYMMRTRMII